MSDEGLALPLIGYVNMSHRDPTTLRRSSDHMKGHMCFLYTSRRRRVLRGRATRILLGIRLDQNGHLAPIKHRGYIDPNLMRCLRTCVRWGSIWLGAMFGARGAAGWSSSPRRRDGVASVQQSFMTPCLRPVIATAPLSHTTSHRQCIPGSSKMSSPTRRTRAEGGGRPWPTPATATAEEAPPPDQHRE